MSGCAPYNQAGRLVKVTDASGSEEMRYGMLGETVWEQKTIASHTQGKSANSPEVSRPTVQRIIPDLRNWNFLNAICSGTG